MLKPQFDVVIDIATREQLVEVVKILLAPHGSPVFGASKLIEHEVAALNALKIMSYIDGVADEFDLVEKLRVTKQKARTLLYQSSLRASENDAVRTDAMRKVLTNPLVMREGDNYLLEVPDPLTMDRLRKRVRALGFISDGSFSGSVAKLPELALLSLVESLISDVQKTAVLKLLQKRGLPDSSIQGAIKALLSTASKKAAGEVGGHIADKVGNLLSEVFENSLQVIQDFIVKNARR